MSLGFNLPKLKKLGGHQGRQGGGASDKAVVSRAPMYQERIQPSYGNYATDTLAFFSRPTQEAASNPVRFPEGAAALIWQMSYARQWADVPVNMLATLDPRTQYAIPYTPTTLFLGSFLVDPNTSQDTPTYPKPSATLIEQERALAAIQGYLLGAP